MHIVNENDENKLSSVNNFNLFLNQIQKVRFESFQRMYGL